MYADDLVYSTSSLLYVLCVVWNMISNAMPGNVLSLSIEPMYYSKRTKEYKCLKCPDFKLSDNLDQDFFLCFCM